MTKTQTWSEAQEILNNLGLNKKTLASATSLFETLLAPKKAGGVSRPAPIVEDGITKYYCRFTDRYYPSEDMVYQNPAKREALDDKGYSSKGLSLWTKGQKYIKDGMSRATEINFGIIKEYNDMKGDELREYAIKLYNEIVALKKDNKPNDAAWLVEKFEV